ncbi:1-(5-phosphoribosyl)-5-((5-phosphoribosylamino)methylideneamino) imidazole-4-carboxamide isomerase [Desulfocurvibacter africanus PCS]|uniref:1-(5-phosphoribosyl)-5-[(5-phosphoribosylamino)methylideneamino] imidazole-4-carboxamide isomerase n=1 Tax=Desulfocurvibacter africanus PCS TaxID=1262666 RepID=M5PUH3_DESAF|nr:1-(5-phosphoribosyl)-5-[(5-phosphoribosylamino)methylideneamino]imidazole-4-carboxamide isomerase [Desulfocurvibacter africanus]EMG37665.1 1-(5-phosphoribosyl)-5-((5-phosphoribosylamino)methylideneamino) imidazole-4-carboxamide isomerase [Desulfocurvibacter africanus PCS]
MILFPAVDIKDGQCVRLRQGRKDEVTVFSADPLSMASHWASQGARWLHVIDLDGAFDGRPKNFDLVASICSTLSIPIQLGGGVRDLDTAKAYIDAGVERLIIGTMALEDQQGFGRLCAELPGRIGVSLDAVDGRLKTKGWVHDAGLAVSDVLPRLTDQGASFIIYTDIGRDGMQSGVNLEALEHLLAHTELPVIVAGGVATLEDVQVLAPLENQGLEGIITGKAIYAGSLDFAAAVRWLDNR